MIYRAYLRTAAGQVTEKTVTPSRAAALVAFEELVGRMDLGGQKLAAALTCDNHQVAFHRFDSQPGHADYWRGRLDEIQWP